MKIPVLALLFLLPVCAEETSSVQLMKSNAAKFLAALDETQRAKASLPFDGDDRGNFRFKPGPRKGLPLGEMDENQRGLAMKLLESALSDKGRLKAMQILTLESVLGDMEKRPDYRNPGNYFVSFFGTPGSDSAWGWKFEGHHVSLNYTVVGGARVAVTPSFFGANPAEVREGEHKGLRVLKAEDELGHALLALLLEGGKNDVLFSDKAPAEILTEEKRDVTALEPVGVAAADMTAAQKKALYDLISEYTGRHRKDLSDADLRKITEAGIGKIRFGWAGGTKPGESWYYRIQGPTFLMEAANTQNNANHIHVTWRDFEGDFGRDLMAEHYKRHEKEDAGR